VDGPLYVRGNVQIKSPDDTTLKQEIRLALCRCGTSANKPYCDNSHLKVAFQASDDVKDNQSKTGEITADGVLEMHLANNGPVRLRGNFEIRSSDGKSKFRGSKASLCRCGGSQNKPFCDGTHRKIGFSSE
jgi:CDGSH-type Zn-finger protein